MTGETWPDKPLLAVNTQTFARFLPKIRFLWWPEGFIIRAAKADGLGIGAFLRAMPWAGRMVAPSVR